MWWCCVEGCDGGCGDVVLGVVVMLCWGCGDVMLGVVVVVLRVVMVFCLEAVGVVVMMLCWCCIVFVVLNQVI